MTDLCRRLLAVALACIVVACSTSTLPPSPSPAIVPGTPGPAASAGTSAPVVATTGPEPGQSAEPSLPGPTLVASATPATPEPSATPASPSPSEPAIPGLDGLLGKDGRFTMLLLGSDARAGLGGERTDTIMIVTIDPATGKVAMLSLPRDTDQVPIGPGRVYGPKINGLFQQFRLNGSSRRSAFRSMMRALGYTFGIEIDRYALVHFRGLVDIINAMGGIDVRLDQPFIDPTSHITKRGLRLHAGVNHLDGGYVLAYSRSRHTTSDYDRARRQQQVIAIAVAKVLRMGIDQLATLAPVVFRKTETNLSLGDVPALFGLAQSAHLGRIKYVVLGPRTYATESPGFANELKLGVVRGLFRVIFGG